jgi:hypothetical protein
MGSFQPGAWRICRIRGAVLAPARHGESVPTFAATDSCTRVEIGQTITLVALGTNNFNGHDVLGISNLPTFVSLESTAEAGEFGRQHRRQEHQPRPGIVLQLLADFQITAEFSSY